MASTITVPREEPSFSERAEGNMSTVVTIPGDPVEDGASIVWLALSSAFAVAVAAQQLRRPTLRHEALQLPRLTRPCWPDEDPDAQSWRLSQFEDLPPSDLAPLYPSLDDPDDFDQGPLMAITQDSRAPCRVDPDVIVVKPRLVRNSR
jgi:hypothetical protein